MSNNAVLIQHTFAGSDHNQLLSLTVQHHLDYCKKYNFDYRFESSTINALMGDWDKVDIIAGALKSYKYVVWLDVDTMIVDINTDLREAMIRPINVVEYPDPCPHYHVGVLYFEETPLLQRFMYDWKNSSKDKPFWAEQGVFNHLAKGKYKWMVKKLGNEWNCSRYYNPCEYPVVRGWHGYTDMNQRINSMKKQLKKVRSSQYD